MNLIKLNIKTNVDITPADLQGVESALKSGVDYFNNLLTDNFNFNGKITHDNLFNKDYFMANLSVNLDNKDLAKEKVNELSLQEQALQQEVNNLASPLLKNAIDLINLNKDNLRSIRLALDTQEKNLIAKAKQTVYKDCLANALGDNKGLYAENEAEAKAIIDALFKGATTTEKIKTAMDTATVVLTNTLKVHREKADSLAKAYYDFKANLDKAKISNSSKLMLASVKDNFKLKLDFSNELELRASIDLAQEQLDLAIKEQELADEKERQHALALEEAKANAVKIDVALPTEASKSNVKFVTLRAEFVVEEANLEQFIAMLKSSTKNELRSLTKVN